jgi:hypothetical protein
MMSRMMPNLGLRQFETQKEFLSALTSHLALPQMASMRS